MINSVEEFFTDGCGRCKWFKTDNCKVHKWHEELSFLRNKLQMTKMDYEVVPAEIKLCLKLGFSKWYY